MTFLADNDVIVHGDAERFRDLDDGMGHLDIGLRGCRIAGRMIVDHSTKIHIVLILQIFFWNSVKLVPGNGACPQ